MTTTNLSSQEEFCRRERQESAFIVELLLLPAGLPSGAAVVTLVTAAAGLSSIFGNSLEVTEKIGAKLLSSDPIPRNRRREGGGKFGFGSTRLTAALRKKTALLFVNQASALAGKGHFSTQPPKCYAHR